MRAAHIIAVVVATAPMVSCSSSSNTSTPIELQSADSIRANEAVDGTPATFGTAAILNEISITVTDPAATSDDGGPWLTLNVRAENPTDGELPSPFFEIHCAGNPDGGGFLGDGTFSGEPLPAKSFDEGTVELLLPGDGRFGEPRPTCTTPATLIALPSNGGVTLQGQQVERIAWPIPDAIIAELNATPQPGTTATS
jgi:hypothetical protein